MDIKNLLDAIGETMVEFVKAQLIVVGLKDSNIIKEVTYKVDEKTQKVGLVLPDYAQYIESGRRAFARKVPIQILIKWMKRKGVGRGNENRIAYAIQNSIYKNGIKPRKFIEKALKNAEKEVENLINLDFSKIIEKEFKNI